MKKILLLLIVLFVLTGCSTSDTNTESNSFDEKKSFVQYVPQSGGFAYDEEHDDSLWGFFENSDGKVIVYGSSQRDYQNKHVTAPQNGIVAMYGLRHTVIFELDEEFNLKGLSDIYVENLSSYPLHITESDEQYLIGGMSSMPVPPYNTSFWNAKISKNGTILQSPVFGEGERSPRKSQINIEGGNLMLGTYPIGDGSNSVATVSKVDEQNNVIWKKDFPGEFTTTLQFAIERDDHYLIGGHIQAKSNGDGDIWLLPLNKDGTHYINTN